MRIPLGDTKIHRAWPLVLSALLLSSASTLSSGASAEPSAVDLNADFQTFCYGLVKIYGDIQNPADGADTIHLQVYNPENQSALDKETPLIYSEYTNDTHFEDWFGVEREYVYESYTIVATYNDNHTETVELPPFSTFHSQPPSIVGLGIIQSEAGNVGVIGRVEGGLSGEEVTVEIYSSANLLWNKTSPGNCKDQFSEYLSAEEAQSLFEAGEEYSMVATHVASGAQGEATFVYGGPKPEPEEQPPQDDGPTAPSSDDDEDSPDNDEEEESDPDSVASGTLISPFLFNNDTIAAPETDGSEQLLENIDVLDINGTLASFHFAKDMRLYILSGNWSMAMNGTAVIDFGANFTMVRADGLDRQAYSLGNLTAVNDSDLILGDDMLALTSPLDYFANGTVTRLNATVTLEKLGVVKIEMDDMGLIYGVVDKVVRNINGEKQVMARQFDMI
jgi:hypothetical protein